MNFRGITFIGFSRFLDVRERPRQIRTPCNFPAPQEHPEALGPARPDIWPGESSGEFLTWFISLPGRPEAF